MHYSPCPCSCSGSFIPLITQQGKEYLMILARIIDGRRYSLPTNNEDEAIRLLGALGIPENHVLMFETTVDIDGEEE
jgi:hypothetical protein